MFKKEYPYIARVLAYAGTVVFCVLMIYFYHISVRTTIVLFFFLLGSVLFLVIDRLLSRTVPTHAHTHSQRAVVKIVIILFFVFFSIAALFLLDTKAVSRPIMFFIFVALLYGTISLEIYLSEDKQDALFLSFILLQIVIVTSLFKSSFFLNVCLYQADPATHLEWAKYIVDMGHLPDFSLVHYYRTTPVFHILYAIIVYFTHIPIYIVQIVMAFIQTLGILFVYVLASNIIENRKAALYSSLLFSFYSLNIEYSVVTTSEGIASFIILLSLVLLIFYYDRPINRAKYFLLLLLSFITILYTHVLYSFITILFIFLTVLPFLIEVPMHKNKGRVHGTLVVTLMTMWFSKQIYLNVYQGPFVAFIKAMETIYDIFEPEKLAMASITSYNPTFYWLKFVIGNLWLLILFSLFVGGILFLIRRPNNLSMPLIFFSVGYFIITVISLVIGRELIFGSRNIYFLGIPLALVGGYFIKRCIEILNYLISPKAALVFGLSVAIFFASFSAVSMMNDKANNRDPIFYDTNAPHLSFHTSAEVDSYSFILAHIYPRSTVISDFRTACRGGANISSQNTLRQMRIVYFSNSSLAELNTKKGYIIVNPYSLTKGLITLEKAPGSPLVYGERVDIDSVYQRLSGRSKIFDSKSIEVYSN